MEIDLIARWLGAFAFVITSANTIWLWLKRPGEALDTRISGIEAKSDKRFGEVAEDLKNHDRRIQAAEDALRHLPTKEDLHEIDNTLAALKSTIESLSHTVTRIDDFLRERAR